MDRRTFLTTSALASGVALAAPSLLLPRRSLAATSVSLPGLGAASYALATLAADSFAGKITDQAILNAGSANLALRGQMIGTFDAGFMAAMQKVSLNTFLHCDATPMLASVVKNIQALQPGYTLAMAQATWNKAKSGANLPLLYDNLQNTGVSELTLNLSQHLTTLAAATPANFGPGHYIIPGYRASPVCDTGVLLVGAFLGLAVGVIAIMTAPQLLALLTATGWATFSAWAGLAVTCWAGLTLIVCAS